MEIVLASTRTISSELRYLAAINYDEFASLLINRDIQLDVSERERERTVSVL